LLSSSSTSKIPSAPLVVCGLKEGGQAGSLGIRDGDVLIGINGSPLLDGKRADFTFFYKKRRKKTEENFDLHNISEQNSYIFVFV
jgi:C-terminal processing protease CtpA/Prc